MLLQELRKIQHRHGYLPEEKLRELAISKREPLYRIQELIGFYPHFTTKPPPRLELHVCRDMACHMNGACELRAELESVFAGSGDVAVKGVSCLGRCDRAPAALLYRWDGAAAPAELYTRVTTDGTMALLRGEKPPRAPAADHDADLKHFAGEFPWLIDDVYGGQASDYRAVRRYRESNDPAKVISSLRKAELHGMGGPGSRASKKWSDVRDALIAQRERTGGDTAYVVCNADESEPGTFKDRDLLTHFPHLVIEGVILGGLVVGARRGYIYVRHEYEEQIQRLEEAIVAAEQQGVCGPATRDTPFAFELEVFVSPGGYICGEQSALIQAMEDKRAEPRNRPPELQTNGLWDKPTLLSNVETFAWAPAIVWHGGDWYAKGSGERFKGRRLFSISGDVKFPGVYEVPIGITLRELLETYANRERRDQPFKAVAMSGPSGGFLPRRLKRDNGDELDVLDLKLDLGVWRRLDEALGAGIVVYGPERDLAKEALSCLEFYRHESCGQCTPCRIGSEKLVQIGRNLVERRYDAVEVDRLKSLIDNELVPAMKLTSICGLGTVAFAPLESLLKYFPEEWRRCLRA